MTQAVSFHDFDQAFRDMNRTKNFSRQGRRALFEYLEQYEEECGEQVELDVIALCCEYTESTIQEALNDYDLEDLDELTDRTIVIFVDDLDNYREYEQEVDGDKIIIYQVF